VQLSTFDSVWSEVQLLGLEWNQAPPENGGAWEQFVIGSSKHRLRASKLSPLFIPSFCALIIFFASARAGADARQAIARAADLVQQGRLEEADLQAHVALADPSTRAVACSVLGAIRLQQKRLPESVKFLQEAIQLEPKLVGARLTLAEAYAVEGNSESALAAYREVLKLDSDNASARLALAQSEAEKGRYKQSLELATPAASELKQTPDGLLLLATDYVNTGDRDAAGRLANDWIQLNGVPEPWAIKFGLLLAQNGAAPEAVQVLEHAKQPGHVSFELAFNLAGVYLLSNNPKLALENYDAALNVGPTSMPALTQAAVIAEKQGELERSLSYWMRAKKLEPENPEILLGFGRVCLKMDLLDDAETSLTKAAGLRPEHGGSQYLLASVKVGKKQFDAAREILGKLVEKTPQDSQLHYALGSVLYLQGQLPDAAAQLTESARLQPQQVASYYYLALIARDQGREAEAIEKLQAVLKQNPDHAPSCEALGELLMSARQYPEAENNLKNAVRLDPSSVKANYQLGLLLARMGKKEESDKQLEHARSLRAEDEKTSRLQLRLLDPDQ
jgi:tetratricopeptide (TPR) repeat protein